MRPAYTAPKMPRLIIGLFPGVVLAALATPPAAQTPAQQGDPRAHTLYVSVLNEAGAPVTGLTAADFIVREDGVAREVVDARPAEAPLDIVLLIDDSAAAADATSYLREGLAAFIERLHGKADIQLMTTGDRPTLVAPFTEDTEQLKARVARIFPRTAAGAYLLDAISEASEALARRKSERPVIVALTFEGIDYSNLHYQRVLDELKESGAALHVIAVGTPSSSMTDEMRNRNIVIAEGTSRTGGRRDQVLALSGIPDKLKQAADELIGQYAVTYQRPDRLIPPERVEVSTTRPNLTVRARTRLETP